MNLRDAARAQNIDNVLHENYSPIEEDDIELTHEQKKIMKSVFERTLLSDQGKAIVRQHENDYDNKVAH